MEIVPQGEGVALDCRVSVDDGDCCRGGNTLYRCARLAGCDG
jgi:hypothetical protein